MATYKEGEDNKLVEDVHHQREEHTLDIEKAREIFKKDLPPFLAVALASRIIGREEAEKLYKIFSKNKLQKI